ncbi:sirohydrochlorin nickelochelatase [Methanobrevibacter filiformis]|uniref:Sirohydrochlorin cobaltochelatase n=1 Tax=Methanobrevibacter filiformis TaxID=55758 RepID=A0A165Z6M2_9EURY|nr:sirohydrochlorin nickelochelatase [Methanobrevibacter filiformis]KZX10312.1 sirohydrochlorin cobaltochelatase [Methanobrevibacter filiformis]
MSSNDKETGILLISHGSRLPYGSEVINTLADMYRDISDYKVAVGYMEIHKPDIATAVEELVKDTNIQKIIAIPVFLAHGVHTKRDIPKILGLVNAEEDHDYNHSNHDHSSHDYKDHKDNHEHKGHHHDHDFKKVEFDGEIIFTDPLGADPLVLEIIKKRINDSL